MLFPFIGDDSRLQQRAELAYTLKGVRRSFGVRAIRITFEPRRF
jgi:hypothetical protein